MEFVASGKYHRATLQFSIQLLDEPTSHEARMQRGFAHFFLGNLALANADFAACAEPPALDPRALAGLALLDVQLLEPHRRQQALARIEVARRVEKERGGETSPFVRFAKAWVLCRNGQADRAAKTLRNNLVRYPDDAFGLWIAGKMAEDQNEFGAAASYFQRALVLDPENPLFISSSAIASLRNESVEQIEPQTVIENLAAIAPTGIYGPTLRAFVTDDRATREALSAQWTNWEAGIANPQCVSEMKALADPLFRLPLYRQNPQVRTVAEELSHWEVLAEENGTAHAYERLSDIYGQMGDFARARELLVESVLREVRYRTVLRLAVHPGTRIAESLAFIQWAAQLEPSGKTHILFAANLYGKLGRWDRTVDIVRAYFSEQQGSPSPDDAIAHGLLGLAYRKLGFYDDSRTHLDHATLRQVPDFQQQAIDDLEREIEFAKRKISLSATPMEISHMVGGGDYARAIATLTEQLSRNNQDSRGHLLALRSLAYMYRGISARAYADATDAVALNPEAPDPLALEVLREVQHSSGAWQMYFYKMLAGKPTTAPSEAPNPSTTSANGFVESGPAF